MSITRRGYLIEGSRFKVPNPLWDPHLAFVATATDQSQGLVEGNTYTVRTDRAGRTISRPVLLGHVKSVREQLADLKITDPADAPPEDRALIEGIDKALIPVLSGILALAVLLVVAAIVEAIP